MTNDHVTDLWKVPKFTAKILSFVFDEAHCISQWADFRKEYKNIGALRYLLPDRIPFYIPSATLPSQVLQDITNTLKLRHQNTEQIMCSNDRPEIALVVQEFVHPVGSYRDLNFLIPKDWKEGDPDPEPFLVFFDNKKEAEEAALHLKSLLPPAHRHKIKWFHSINTPEFRTDEVNDLREGKSWGDTCTESFGMVRWLNSFQDIELTNIPGN